jgi:large subunit ribosomal protein L30
MGKKLVVTQTKSIIKELEPMKRTMIALGIRKMHQTVTHEDTPVIRGMVQRVCHLVTVTEVDE